MSILHSCSSAVWVAASALICGNPLWAAAPENFRNLPASFKVSTEVVNEDVEPFNVTAPAFGNTLRRAGAGSFEPGSLRQRFLASQASPDRIYTSGGNGIGHFGLYASGYLDGADVRVYRILNGQMRIVREDKVARGGSVIENWDTGNPNRILIRGSQRAQFKWDDWSRPNAKRWFTVFAVDQSGRLSAPATPVQIAFTKAVSNSQPTSKEADFRTKGAPSDQPPPAPQNFKAVVNADGIVEFSWDAVSHETLAGYRIGRTDTDPSRHRGIYLQLDGKATSPEAQIRKGDLVIVARSLLEFNRDWMSNRVANLNREVVNHYPAGIPNDFHPGETAGKDWKLVRHEPSNPVSDPGDYYLEMTLREGDVESVGKSGIPDISNSTQDFYLVPSDGKEYIMEVWMKADRPDRKPVVFTFDGDRMIGGFIGEHPLQLSTEWHKYSVRVTGQSSQRGNPTYLVLRTSGPGTFSFDNFRVYRADADYLDYLPENYAQLKQSGMAAFRTHAPIKTELSTYSMHGYLGAPGQASGVPMGNTLPQTLRVCEKSDIAPWLQIEFHMAPSEWLAFVEYLAAPYDPAKDTPASKPAAAVRHAQGRTAPWTDAFERIYFELGNETWNSLFAPWIFEEMPDGATPKRWSRGEAYGMFQDHVAEILRSSPYWSPALEEKFVHVMGGWATTLNGRTLESGYTQEITKATRSGEFITIAAYNGGWDEGEGPPKTDLPSYFNVLTSVAQTAIPRAREFKRLQDHHASSGRNFGIGTYEAGPGYALNGLNNASVTREEAAQQELVMKSKRAGTATLDTFLAQSYFNYDLQNFFTFAEGDLWKSHAHRRRGGQPHASFLPLQVFNQLGTGSMLAVETLSVPLVDTPDYFRRPKVKDVPLAAAYATRSGQRLNLFCLSRRVAGYPAEDADGFTPFEVQLPFTRAGSLTLYRLTGAPEDHNIDSERVKLETLRISPTELGSDGRFRITQSTGGGAKGLPQSEWFLYVFEDTNMP